MKYKLIKISIVLLALFAVFGTVGFGVYSYYYAQGSISYESDSFTTGSFDPQVSFDDHDFAFISSATSSDIKLTCSDSGYGEAYAYAGTPVSCTGQINVKNNGSDPIRVKLTDLQLKLNVTGGGQGFVLTTNQFSADYTDFVLEPTASQEVNFTANYQFDYDRETGVDLSDEPSNYSEHEISESLEVIGSVLITASQNLED